MAESWSKYFSFILRRSMSLSLYVLSNCHLSVKLFVNQIIITITTQTNQTRTAVRIFARNVCVCCDFYFVKIDRTIII